MTRRVVRVRGIGRFLSPVGEEFVAVEALSGVILLLAAACALVWANVASSSYGDFVEYQGWINDGLMTVFFFVVGLEIKREFVSGELRDPRAALVPVVAAVGGMVVPACIYLAFNAGTGAAEGWGVPIATDIALTVGVLSLLGALVPPALRLFVLTFAIVDDIGAIVVIALFYSHGIAPAWLAGAVGCIVLVLAMNRMHAPLTLYLVPAVGLWLCVYESGVHATIAGVALAFLVPGERLEAPLHLVSGFLIVPLFALANAGIVLTRDVFGDAITSRVGVGILAGLVVGKTIGVWGATALAVRFRWGRLHETIRLRQVAGGAVLAGIGFTVSLFVANLAFTGETLETAKIAVLTASAVAGVAGAIVVALARTGSTRR
jgi:Na+:H+ antiporter, NhaA family